jgi:hypothetical protein
MSVTTASDVLDEQDPAQLTEDSLASVTGGWFVGPGYAVAETIVKVSLVAVVVYGGILVYSNCTD